MPDTELALREIRRILQPDGGRAIISTNGAYTMRRLYELHGEAARELGYQPLPISPGHFTMHDLPLVQRIFPGAQRTQFDGALVFPSAAPALRFYASNRIDALLDRPADNSHRVRLLQVMRGKIEAAIAREGAFVIPKSVGLFTTCC